VALDYELINN